MTGLQLYANFISQPSRSVAWVLKTKDIKYELIQADFDSPVFSSPEFLKLNPNGLIPVIKDGDFSLYEGNAILVYLAEKHGWTDLYPQDLHTRAKINQYLSWHHTNTRLHTPQVLGPLIRSKVGALTPQDEVYLKNINDVVTKNAKLLEEGYLADKPFVAGTDTPTLADYACYCEVGQIAMLGIFDYSAYPKLAAWMERMKGLEHHDELHTVLTEFLSSLGLLASKAA
jgi:glutathione S-transferase/autophagy-related protein 2